MKTEEGKKKKRKQKKEAQEKIEIDEDRKNTRQNTSHVANSYTVYTSKKKKPNK